MLYDNNDALGAMMAEEGALARRRGDGSGGEIAAAAVGDAKLHGRASS